MDGVEIDSVFGACELDPLLMPESSVFGLRSIQSRPGTILAELGKMRMAPMTGVEGLVDMPRLIVRAAAAAD
jgi:hypothetical protein